MLAYQHNFLGLQYICDHETSKVGSHLGTVQNCRMYIGVIPNWIEEEEEQQQQQQE